MESFEQFLNDYVPKIAAKQKQFYQALWLLETTGSKDAADLNAALDVELRLLYHDPKIYQQLLEWKKGSHTPQEERQLNILTRLFKQNQIAKELLEEIANKEAALLYSYANFRPLFEGKPITENGIRALLKTEKDEKVRKKAWETSKQIGDHLAPQILELVKLRNKAAKSLGYSDYFHMQLDLQEVDEKWLFQTFEELYKDSEKGYVKALQKIKAEGSLNPWDWSEPFAQEDPVDSQELDHLINGADFAQVSQDFYKRMGIDVKQILDRSDMYEREGKNQHAFCIHMDREGDIRNLNNVKPTLKWFETVLHELGHAIYELGFDPVLPWLLKEPPHMITTEAMALIAGRQAYLPTSLSHLSKDETLIRKATESLQRRQLIFSRWVLVMTSFERELYRNPQQDLNKLWWQLVHKYQHITTPPGREGKNDWAAKYHIGLAPVYYFSYLLGELFASTIQAAYPALDTLEAGRFLNEKLFKPGNSYPWNKLVEHVTGAPLSSKAWVEQFT